MTPFCQIKRQGQHKGAVKFSLLSCACSSLKTQCGSRRQWCVWERVAEDRPSVSPWNDPTPQGSPGWFLEGWWPTGTRSKLIPRTTEVPSIKVLLTLQLWSSNSCSQGAVACAPEFPSHWPRETRGTALRIHLSHQWILGSIFQKNLPKYHFFENHCFLQEEGVKPSYTSRTHEVSKRAHQELHNFDCLLCTHK